MYYLHRRNILEGLVEVVLIHSSSTRPVPSCRTEILVNHSKPEEMWGRGDRLVLIC